MKIRFFYVVLHISASLVGISLTSHGQTQKKIDSLKSILAEKIPDSTRIASLRALCQTFYPEQLDSALYYGDVLNSFSNRIGSNLGKVEAIKVMANVYLGRKDYSKSVEYYEQAVTLLEGIGADINKIIPLQVGAMNAHSKNNDSKKALEIGLSLLPTIQDNKINDKNRSLVFKNLGNVYLNSGDHETALYYYKKCGQVYTDIKKNIKDQNDNARNLLIKRDYVHSLELSLQLIDIIDDEDIAQEDAFRTCLTLGSIYMVTKKHDDAIYYLKKAEGYTDRESDPYFLLEMAIE